MIKGPIAYPGAKYKALGDIFELVPDGVKDWREPFFGGGSVTIGFLQSDKSSKCEQFTVGELAPEVYSFWKGIQEDAEAVRQAAVGLSRKMLPSQEALWSAGMMEAVQKLLRAERDKQKEKDVKDSWELSVRYDDAKDVYERVMHEGRAFWRWAAEADCTKMTLPERAARFFIVSRLSFSAMADSGSLSIDNYLSWSESVADRLLDVAPLLQRIEIKNQSFEKTMEGCDEERGFIFLDPPYLTQAKSGLYGRNGDTHKSFDHKFFAKTCKETKAKWLITYDDSIAVRKLFRGKGIQVRPFHIEYTMAGKASSDALAGEEIFIANYDITSKYKSTYAGMSEIL